MQFCITMKFVEELLWPHLPYRRGQVTFRKKVLEHLGIKPGEKIELELLPDGRGMLRAAGRVGKDRGLHWRLAGKTKKVATIEEMNEAAADWLGGR